MAFVNLIIIIYYLYQVSSSLFVLIIVSRDRENNGYFNNKIKYVPI
jgi:hypothetical protein